MGVPFLEAPETQPFQDDHDAGGSANGVRRRGLMYCAGCGAFVADRAHARSSRFLGSTGPATLYDRTSNTVLGPAEKRKLLSGLHFVREAHCKRCRARLGWFYEMAEEAHNRDKEGRTCLEDALLTEETGRGARHGRGAQVKHLGTERMNYEVRRVSCFFKELLNLLFYGQTVFVLAYGCPLS